MIVDGDRENALGPLLADDVVVELLLDGPRRRDVAEDGMRCAAAALLLIDDRLAQLDALAADVDVAGALDERADFAIALAAKGTMGIAIAS